MNKRIEYEVHRRRLAGKAVARYIPKSENYKTHFVGLSLWLEGFSAGLRHAGRIAKQRKIK